MDHSLARIRVPSWTLALDSSVDDQDQVFIVPVAALPPASAPATIGGRESIAHTAYGWYDAIDSAATLYRTLADFGVKGRISGDGKYLVLKGLAGARQFLRGTRYRADNAKVVQFCIGSRGGLASFRASLKTFRWFLLADITVETALSVLRGGDMGDLVADESLAVAKTVLATAAGTMASVAAASAGIAVAPVIAGIVVSWAVSTGLDALADDLHLTEKMRDLVESLHQFVTEPRNEQGAPNRGTCPFGGFPRTIWDTPNCAS